MKTINELARILRDAICPDREAIVPWDNLNEEGKAPWIAGAEAMRKEEPKIHATHVVTYEGIHGYLHERLVAVDVGFIAGQNYEVIGGSQGQSRTTYRIKGMMGTWNSVLFKGEIDIGAFGAAFDRTELRMNNNS